MFAKPIHPCRHCLVGEDWNGTTSTILFDVLACLQLLGALYAPHWFQLAWPPNWIPLNIPVKKLLSIIWEQPFGAIDGVGASRSTNLTKLTLALSGTHT
jgi:hypothetical protein